MNEHEVANEARRWSCEELFAFAAGELPVQVHDQLARDVEDDEELAAQLAFMGLFVVDDRSPDAIAERIGETTRRAMEDFGARLPDHRSLANEAFARSCIAGVVPAGDELAGFVAVSQAVRAIVRERAAETHEAVGSRPVDWSATNVALQAEETTVRLSARAPQVVLERDRRLQGLFETDESAATAYLLHEFGGRTLAEIGQLLDQPLAAVLEELSFARVDVLEG